MTVYFDTSIFLAIFNREPGAIEIKRLLRELKAERVRIYTSIISVQEACVLGYRRGKPADDNASQISKLARIHEVTKQIALTCAKFEAALKDRLIHLAEAERINENRRRKWDCFHIATAVALRCRTFYTLDEEQLARREQLELPMEFLRPMPKMRELPFAETAALAEAISDPTPPTAPEQPS